MQFLTALSRTSQSGRTSMSLLTPSIAQVQAGVLLLIDLAQQEQPPPPMLAKLSTRAVVMLAGKWRPSQTDVMSMVNSTVSETGGLRCILVDMGCFYLAEFGATLCQPFVGSAVHGGVHMLQIQSTKLQPRLLMFPLLNSTFKVSRITSMPWWLASARKQSVISMSCSCILALVIDLHRLSH